MKLPMRSVLFAVFLVSLVIPILRAQVSNDRLLRSADEPRNWMMYSGTYASQRYSTLSQINPSNVKNLEQKWIFQAESLEKFETTPLVVEGIMYITQAPSDALALDAKTGRVFWIYRYYPSTDARPCCGSVNRGLAILGDTLFLATLDAHLIALDAKTGRPIWNTRVANASAGYAMTVAPLVVKDKVIVGVAGGDSAFVGLLLPMMCARAAKRGDSTPFLVLASRVMKPGKVRRTHGNTGEAQSGPPVHMIPPST